MFNFIKEFYVKLKLFVNQIKTVILVVLKIAKY
jgi:hypothetical protein